MMVVLDSSAVIPLLTIGRLDLIKKVFKEVYVPSIVWQEVVEEGIKAGKRVMEFEKGKNVWFQILSSPPQNVCSVFAQANHLHIADAAVLLTAKQKKDVLLTNDAALHACALSQQIPVWWLTTLLLAATKKNVVSKSEAELILFDLVHIAKMRLNTDVFSELLGIIRNL